MRDDPAEPARPLRPPRLAAAIALVVLLAAGAAYALWPGAFDLEGIKEVVCAPGLAGAAAIIALMILHCFLPFPAEIVALAAGACLGFWPGLASVWAGAMVGAQLSFELSRHLGRPFLMRLLSTRALARLDRWTDERGAAALLMSRFLPVIAFNLINYAAGLTSAGRLTFAWTTGLGILPVTVLTVWLGAEMRAMPETWLLALAAGGIALVLLGHWLVRRWRAR
ncbi:MAG TPA: VTT domain-containing protein [Paracoccaceae bacterium]|nr:VTT domain-containing protein [Paracoccaceae bacterium]